MDDILTWLKKHKVITFIIAFLVFCGPLIIVHALFKYHPVNTFGLLNGQLAMLSAILLDLKRWLEQLCWE